MSDNFIDFYQLLEVSRTASEDEIKQALKNQRRTWQKRQASGDQSKRHLAEEQMRRLDEANSGRFWAFVAKWSNVYWTEPLHKLR